MMSYLLYNDVSSKTQTEHAKSLTKLALEAAASSDVALRQGSRVSQPLPEISPMGRQHFSAAVSLIDTGSFVSLSFKSSRSLKALKVKFLLCVLLSIDKCES